MAHADVRSRKTRPEWHAIPAPPRDRLVGIFHGRPKTTISRPLNTASERCRPILYQRRGIRYHENGIRYHFAQG
jgi:hypothetical protein